MLLHIGVLLLDGNAPWTSRRALPARGPRVPGDDHPLKTDMDLLHNLFKLWPLFGRAAAVGFRTAGGLLDL